MPFSHIVQDFEEGLPQHTHIEVDQTFLLVKIWVFGYRNKREVPAYDQKPLV